MVNAAAIPQLLKDFPHWIVWKLEKRKGQTTKVPYDAKNGGPGKSNDPSTWATFDVALEAAEDELSKYDGVGFMLQGTDLVGIDFDGVVKGGLPEPYVLNILTQLGHPYSEITPSGNGLRVFIQCAKLPAGQRKFPSGNHYGAEIYSGAEGGRYLTVTGNHYGGGIGVPVIEDMSVPYFMVSQFRNEKLRKLWMGDTEDYKNDDSVADLALCAMLARGLNNDPVKVEAMFDASVRGQREKWLQRDDYRRRTIAKACGVAPIASPTFTAYGGESAQPVSDACEPEFEADFEHVVTEAKPKKIFELGMRTAASIIPKHVKWLWKDRVPLGKITLFAGNPDNGKSLAASSIAAICSTGRPFGDTCPNKLEASEVLMMIGEDDLDDTVIPRLMASEAALSKIYLLESVIRPGDPDTEVRLDTDVFTIDAMLEKNPKIRLVIIDPISNYLGNASMIAEQEARRSVLIPLKQMAARRNVAVIMVMHLNKKSELDAIGRVGGAMAFIGVARCSWMFIRDAADAEGEVKDTFSMVRIKNNLAKASGDGLSYRIEAKKPIDVPGDVPMWPPYVIWGEAVNRTADDMLESKRGTGRPTGTDTKTQDAVRFLSEFLAEGPKPAKEVFAQAKAGHGILEGALRSAAKALNVKISQHTRQWVWELTEMDEANHTPTEASADASGEMFR
jgi:hypothetical protein